jgi:hypothetical protein
MNSYDETDYSGKIMLFYAEIWIFEEALIQAVPDILYKLFRNAIINIYGFVQDATEVRFHL